MARSAEYYRHHKRCFDLAQELGCTPKEAECELRRRETAARWAKTEEDLRTHERAHSYRPEPINDERWMMRD